MTPVENGEAVLGSLPSVDDIERYTNAPAPHWEWCGAGQTVFHLIDLNEVKRHAYGDSNPYTQSLCHHAALAWVANPEKYVAGSEAKPLCGLCLTAFQRLRAAHVRGIPR